MRHASLVLSPQFQIQNISSPQPYFCYNRKKRNSYHTFQTIFHTHFGFFGTDYFRYDLWKISWKRGCGDETTICGDSTTIYIEGWTKNQAYLANISCSARNMYTKQIQNLHNSMRTHLLIYCGPIFHFFQHFRRTQFR